MDTLKVKRVFETRDVEECNAYLDCGWELLQTAGMETDSREYSGPIIKYALGWTHGGEPVIPKRRYE